MLTIIHGDNLVSSRGYLNAFIKQADKKAMPVRRFVPTSFQAEDLASALEPGLFDQNKLIIIDDWQKFSLPKQEQITKIISQIKSDSPIVIWANKKLTVKAIKLFPSPRQEKLFKTSSQLFTFLDSFYPGNKKSCLKLLKQTLDKEEVGLVFYLLVSRVEDLIIVKTGHQDKLAKAAWQTKRLAGQAEKFELNQLKELLHQLINIDYQQKTGRLAIPVEFGLELLIAKL